MKYRLIEIGINLGILHVPVTWEVIDGSMGLSTNRTLRYDRWTLAPLSQWFRPKVRIYP